MAEDAARQGGESSAKLVLIMIIGAVLLVAVSMGGVFFLLKSMGMLSQGGHAPVAANAPAIYHPMEPAFIVNFKERGRTKYLQVQVELMTRDSQAIDDVIAHTPLLRNNLLLLLGSQTAEILHSPEGREELRKKALEEVQRILIEETGRQGIEALYFTSFITQ
ncbi:MAG: flagellar basal body-associated FliL family protein [Gammaproteobacteria bacterium]|nr:flagellar basal body-associated FliL family protein [Gammaproteobacteria bacterium]MDH5729987.1 flagellar basal body-associated FliL family protein [Gammaproteobacteria bacterium]